MSSIYLSSTKVFCSLSSPLLPSLLSLPSPLSRKINRTQQQCKMSAALFDIMHADSSADDGESVSGAKAMDEEEVPPAPIKTNPAAADDEPAKVVDGCK